MGDFIRLRQGESCPICGRPGNCNRNTKGIYFCLHRRGEGVPGYECVGEASGGVFWMYVLEGTSFRSGGSGSKPKKPKDPFQWEDLKLEREAREAERESEAAWRSVKNRRHVEQLEKDSMPIGEAGARKLGGGLGIPWKLLQDFGVRFLSNDTYNKSCHLFPEHDGQGRIKGYNQRYADGSKISHTSRGLTIPPGGIGAQGPICIVEGASDTLALTSIGHVAIGRPSNTGGVNDLAELLQAVPRERPIVFIGENDCKPDGSWPGKHGAESSAKRLAELLGRVVCVCMPPVHVKDSRAWVNGLPSELTAQQRYDAWTVIIDQVEHYGEPETPDATGLEDIIAAWDALAAEPREPEPERERPHPPCCSNCYSVILRSRTTRLHRVVFIPCRKWDCFVCVRFLKSKWLSSLSYHFATAGRPIWVGQVTEESWQALRKHILRAKGRYVWLRQPAGKLLLFATVPFDGGEERSALEAARALRTALEALGPGEKPLFSCRAWKLLEANQITKEWDRVMMIEPGTDYQALLEVLNKNGLPAKEKTGRPGGRIQASILFKPPPSWSQARIDHLCWQLSIGEFIPWIEPEEEADEPTLVAALPPGEFDLTADSPSRRSRATVAQRPAPREVPKLAHRNSEPGILHGNGN